MSKCETRLVAYDYSGSTEAVDFYHITVQRILTQYEPYDVVIWNNNLKESSPRELARINRTRDGDGGTRPILVAEHCFNKQIRGHLILITDGEILPRHVEALDEYLSTHPLQLTHIDCYLIQTAENDKLDATVIAPFLRGFPHIVYVFALNAQDPVILANGGSSNEEFLEELGSISTVADFQAKFDRLFSEIVSKMLGKSQDLAMRDAILAMQRRLMNEMKRLPPGFDRDALKAAFETGNEPEMIRLSRELHDGYLARWAEPTWPPQLFHLLRMCTGNLGQVYSLSALGSRFQADRVRRADVVQNFEVSDVSIANEGAPFLCPISYEEERDTVLLVVSTKEGLLAGEEGDVVNTIITNPLSAVRYPAFCKKLVSHLDHPVSLQSIKDAQQAGFPLVQSPLTRAPIIGGLCLSPAEEHAKVTNSVIAKLVADGKRVGNPDCWFVLIWWLIEEGWVPHLVDILPQVRQHLIFRLKSHLGTFTLTNVPYLPVTLVPMGIAFWTTLCAVAYGAGEDKASTYLKCHIGHVPILQKTVELIGYPIPDSARSFINRYLTFTHIRRLIIDRNFEAISWAIRAVHQFREIDLTKVSPDHKFPYVPSVIPIDGEEPSPEQVSEALAHLPQWFAGLSVQERRAAVRMLELFDIGSINFGDLARTTELINWQYQLRNYDLPAVPICPATCRPFHIVLPEHVEWYEMSKRVFGDIEHQIHVHRYFIECVTKLHAFPTKEEFLVFMFHAIVPRHKPTLPRLILEFADVVMNGYAEIMKTITPADFIKIAVRSERLAQRREMEHNWRQLQ
jgi:hypothetical protein